MINKKIIASITASTLLAASLITQPVSHLIKRDQTNYVSKEPLTWAKIYSNSPLTVSDGVTLPTFTSTPDEASDNNEIYNLLKTYSESRESELNDENNKMSRKDELQKAEALSNLDITDISVASVVTSCEESGESYIIKLTEYVILDYDDLTDKIYSIDSMSYGIEHKITVELNNGKPVIANDSYNEFQDKIKMCALAYDKPNSISSELQFPEAKNNTYTFFNEYNAEDCIFSSNKWFYEDEDEDIDINSYYKLNTNDNNSLDNLSAQFVSSCISKGGMPEIINSPSENQNWFCNSNEMSESWNNPEKLWQFLSNYRGRTVNNPESSEIYSGSPIFIKDNIDSQNIHTYICTGKNSAGRPVMSSYGYLQYNVVWDFFGESAAYSTIQLTDKNPYSENLNNSNTDSTSEKNSEFQQSDIITGIYKCTNNNTNIKEKALEASLTVGTLEEGKEYIVSEVYGNWGKINYNGTDTWCKIENNLECVSPLLLGIEATEN